MRQDWKNTLYLYVDQHNRSEVDDRNYAVQAPIEDMDYVMKASERARRLKLWYRERGTTPLKSETKAKIVRKHECDGEVAVDLEFHVQREYDQQGVTLFDERIDIERLILNRDGDRWIITRVETPAYERHGNQVEGELVETRSYAEKQSRSVPLLNRDVLGNIRPQKLVPYRREKAVQYAEQWWNEPNPRFLSFEVDCTNYVSQCLFAGGVPMNYTGRREAGWWYKGMVNGQEGWSYSWAVANSLERLLANSGTGLRAELVEQPTELQLGDIIAYDWDGNGHYQHTTIVTAFDVNGMPLINAHTTNSRHRYWDYQDSYAWTEATQYRFLHIVDAL